jgi:hypothetical protein
LFIGTAVLVENAEGAIKSEDFEARVTVDIEERGTGSSLLKSGGIIRTEGETQLQGLYPVTERELSENPEITLEYTNAVGPKRTITTKYKPNTIRGASARYITEEGIIRIAITYNPIVPFTQARELFIIYDWFEIGAADESDRIWTKSGAGRHSAEQDADGNIVITDEIAFTDIRGTECYANLYINAGNSKVLLGKTGLLRIDGLPENNLFKGLRQIVQSSLTNVTDPVHPRTESRNGLVALPSALSMGTYVWLLFDENGERIIREEPSSDGNGQPDIFKLCEVDEGSDRKQGYWIFRSRIEVRKDLGDEPL